MGHHSRLEVMAFYQGAVALMGFFYSLNVVLTGAGHDTTGNSVPYHCVRLKT
jgi:hypothetical protein